MIRISHCLICLLMSVHLVLNLLLFFQLILFIACPVISTIAIRIGYYARVATVLTYIFVFGLPLFVVRVLDFGKIK
jgi:hypothetical protein